MEENADQRVSLGYVTFTTKLVDFDYGSQRGASSGQQSAPHPASQTASPPLSAPDKDQAAKGSTISPASRGMLSRRNSLNIASSAAASDAKGSSTSVSFVLHRANPRQTKWPAKFLSAETAPSGNARGQRASVLAHASLAPAKERKLSSKKANQMRSASDASDFPGHIGFISCGWSALAIDVEPHSVGIMLSCDEYDAVTSSITISWDDVRVFCLIIFYCMV